MGMEFKDKLSALMHEKKLSKMELSRRARISRPTIDRYLKGGEPNRRMIRDLADGLEVPIEELIVPAKKTGRELFKDLGYEEMWDLEDMKTFARDFKRIEITKINSKADDSVYIDIYVYDPYRETRECTWIDGQELQAINKMIEELGWGYDEE